MKNDSILTEKVWKYLHTKNPTNKYYNVYNGNKPPFEIDGIIYNQTENLFYIIEPIYQINEESFLLIEEKYKLFTEFIKSVKPINPIMLKHWNTLFDLKFGIYHKKKEKIKTTIIIGYYSITKDDFILLKNIYIK
jgi:hypothetical protein